MAAIEMGEEVTFWNRGCRLAGTLVRPAGASAAPIILQGPGWLGLRSAKLYQPYHEALVAAGFAVLAIDYRGFGDSEGDPTYVDPTAQVDDLRAALDYVDGRDDLDSRRVGVFGSGGTGGGNAIAVAGLDRRVKAVVSQVPIADGREWLHRMRREDEWLGFLERIDADRRHRAVGEPGELVKARDGIVVPTAERRATTVKRDVDSRIAESVQLASAEAILNYRPIDQVARIAPRATMIICVEGDAVTPEDQALALFEAAGPPKRLVIQSGTTHYAAYERYRHFVAPLIVGWFEQYLVGGDVAVHDVTADGGVSRVWLS